MTTEDRTLRVRASRRETRAEKLLAEIVGDWPCHWSVDIAADAFKRWTVTLFHQERVWQKPREINHCHTDDLEQGLKWALIWKQEDSDA